MLLLQSTPIHFMWLCWPVARPGRMSCCQLCSEGAKMLLSGWPTISSARSCIGGMISF